VTLKTDDENSVLIKEINYILKYIQIFVIIFHNITVLFYCFIK